MMNLSGRKFSRLTAIRPVGQDRAGYYIWLCICTCGNQKKINGNALRAGTTKSCGCLRRPHGASHSRTYFKWRSMRRRCYDKKAREWKWYGARGIRVCSRWKDFKNFLKDMGNAPPGMELERCNNNRGYSPGNCRWATRKEQCRNTRANKFIVYGGEKICVSALIEKLGLHGQTFRNRLRYGWSVKEAVEVPIQKKNRNYGSSTLH